MVYFISDAHLGSRALTSMRTRERRLVNFLDCIKHKATAIYLLGDIFDFWFEYRNVVPKGYTRFLGKSLMVSIPGENKTKISREDTYVDMLGKMNLLLETYYAAEKNICIIHIP